jgi:hypothetical protein
MAQFRTDKQKFLNNGNTIFEVVMLSTNTGSPISTSNRLPVTLGSDTITISGNVIVGSVVTVNSSPSNPVHTHITEVGTSGILNVNYLPVAGNVSIHHSNGANITSTVPLPTYVTSIPNLDNAPWEIQVARGLVANVVSVYRNAYNPDCAKDTEETIWYEGGLYPWSSWTTAQKLYVISTNALDTGEAIFIEGLDAAYNYQSETITTNGLTAVATVKNYLRLTKAHITSDVINGNYGNITFRLTSGTGTVVGHMGPNVGQTKLAVYTVPAGKTAYLVKLDASSFNGGVGAIGTQIRLYSKPYDQVFNLIHVGETINSQYIEEFKFPIAFTEKTDIDTRAYSSSNGTRVSANFNILLIDN